MSDWHQANHYQVSVTRAAQAHEALFAAYCEWRNANWLADNADFMGGGRIVMQYENDNPVGFKLKGVHFIEKDDELRIWPNGWPLPPN